MTHDETIAATEPIDLLAVQGTGPLWGMASADLNATLLSPAPRAAADRAAALTPRSPRQTSELCV